MNRLRGLRRHRMFAILLGILCFVASSIAQTESARVQGTVTDTFGAAVAGATVTITSLGTARVVTAQTNEEGLFSVLALQPGRCQIEVGQTSFKTTKREVTLEVAQNATLDFALEPGAVTETVTITNDTPLVESSTSAIGNVVRGREIVELPLTGRNVLELPDYRPA